MASGKEQVIINQQKASRPTAKGLGITTERPKFPIYAQITKRRESFQQQNWPSENPMTIDSLVKAGLVYTGVGDSVRCYHCGGGLRNWDAGDNPMVEHARWYPNCPHVALVKGKKFIDMIADGEVPEEDCPDNQPKIESDDFPCDSVLKTTAGEALLEMDIPKDHILKAAVIFKKRNGHTNLTAEKLCQICFELEENPEIEETVVQDKNIRSSVDSGYDSKDESESETDDEELVQENETLKQKHNCKICLESQADIILLPCGHLVTCAQCAPAMSNCPICRKTVHGLVKAYFACLK